MSEVVTGILLTLGVLLGLILLPPIHFDAGGEYADRLNLQGRGRWAGGLLSLEIIRSEGRYQCSLGLLGLKKAIPKSEKKTPSSKKPRTRKRRASSNGNILSFVNPSLFFAIKAVLFKLVQALHLGLDLAGTYGFDDPSLTGVTMGVIATLNSGSNAIDLNPDFTKAVVDIRGRIWGWVSPFQIIVIGVGFFLKKPVRAIWWPKIKTRKKQKEAFQYV